VTSTAVRAGVAAGGRATPGFPVGAEAAGGGRPGEKSCAGKTVFVSLGRFDKGLERGVGRLGHVCTAVVLQYLIKSHVIHHIESESESELEKATWSKP